MVKIENKENERIIRQIIDQLHLLNLPQLETIQQGIEAIRSHSHDRLHNLGRLLGIKWTEEGEALMQLGAFNANLYGVAQGGALYTLADIAIGYEILNQLKEYQRVFTLEMKMNFIQKGTGSKLIAQTEILHWGRKTVVGQCQIRDESRTIIAQSLGTFFIVEEK